MSPRRDVLPVSAVLRAAAPRLVLSVAAGVVGAALSIVQLALITRVLTGGPLSLGAAFASAFGVLLTMGASKVLGGVVAERLAADLRGLVFRRISAMKLRAAEELGADRMVAALRSDVDAIVVAVNTLSHASTNALLLVAGVAYGAYLQPRLMLVMFVVSLPSAIGYAILTKRVGTLFEQARDPHLVRMYELMQFLPPALAKLKSSAPDKTRVATAFETTLDAVLRLHVRAMKAFGFAQEGGRFVFYLVFFAMLAASSHLGATPGETVSFAVTLLYLLNPLEAVLVAAPGLSQAKVALTMLENLELTPDESADPSQLPEHFRHVRIEGVEMTYAGAEGFRFGPASAELVPGKVFFVTGGNGSGKSTFIKILSGLYPPDRGRIVWDGAVVDDSNRGAYRSLFSVILPDDPLLADVLAIDPLPQSTEVLRELSPGPSFDPTVPGSSKALSYGQRSRVALLEAWQRDRPILVLDEWAANQDPHRRKLFYEEVIPALRARGKCVVVISHDDAFFGIADVRLHLDRGTVDQVIEAEAEAEAS